MAAVPNKINCLATLLKEKKSTSKALGLLIDIKNNLSGSIMASIDTSIEGEACNCHWGTFDIRVCNCPYTPFDHWETVKLLNMMKKDSYVYRKFSKKYKISAANKILCSLCRDFTLTAYQKA